MRSKKRNTIQDSVMHTSTIKEERNFISEAHSVSKESESDSNLTASKDFTSSSPMQYTPDYQSAKQICNLKDELDQRAAEMKAKQRNTILGKMKPSSQSTGFGSESNLVESENSSKLTVMDKSMMRRERTASIGSKPPTPTKVSVSPSSRMKPTLKPINSDDQIKEVRNFSITTLTLYGNY